MMSAARSSMRKAAPSAKLQANMDAHKDLIDDLYRKIEASKETPSQNCKAKADAIKSSYSKVRTALGATL